MALGPADCTGPSSCEPSALAGPPALLALSATLSVAAEVAPRRPLPIDFRETTTYRWLNKKVLESRLLDDMESPATWVKGGRGGRCGGVTTGGE